MNSTGPFEEAAAILRDSRRTTFFTGAEVSAESGVPTFRDQDGFWNRFPPARFAHRAGLEYQDRFFAKYQEIIAALNNAWEELRISEQGILKAADRGRLDQ